MDENVIPESCAEFSAIRGFIFDFFRPSTLFSRRPAMFSSVSIHCLLTQMSMQFLFRESCADSVNYKHNSLFFFIFWLFLLYFSVRARVDHVSLNFANQRKRTVRFFNPVIPPRISCMQSRNSEGYLGIPPPAHTFNLQSRHDFALKSRIPSSK